MNINMFFLQRQGKESSFQAGKRKLIVQVRYCTVYCSLKQRAASADNEPAEKDNTEHWEMSQHPPHSHYEQLNVMSLKLMSFFYLKSIPSINREK